MIVALTSEGPELSDRYYKMVLEPLRASGATLHVVSIGRPMNMNEDRSMALSLGTRDTGGRYDTLLILRPFAPGSKMSPPRSRASTASRMPDRKLSFRPRN